MKHALKLVTLVGILSLTGCATHNGLTTNVNNHSTEVVLAKKNFTVLNTVRGESSVTYVFGIGGLSKNALIAEAKQQMLKEAKLEGGARALINETVEVKGSLFPIVGKTVVTVTAQVIEFTE